MYDVNVFGPLELCQAFSHLLVRAAHEAVTDLTAKDVHRSVIVNIGSIAGPLPGFPFMATYAASKVRVRLIIEHVR